MNPRLIVFVTVAAALLTVQPARAQSSPAVPRFEGAACPFTVDRSLTEGKDIRCGYLVVPENRALNDGKTIKLAVAIVKTANSRAAPDPTIYLAGGPGQSAIRTFGTHMTDSLRQFFAPDRDFILIDQRGTGFSQPSLACPAGSAPTRLPSRPPTLAQEETREAQFVTACRTRLVKNGVDLSAYTSEENARDIADLRVALGYDQVNLDGGSYGTRLALSVMRYAPTGIRSVVLDSVYGPTVNLFTDTERAAARVFRLVFDDCARSPACKKRNPDLGKNLRALVTRLDRKPVKLTLVTNSPKTQKIWLTGEGLLSVVYGTLYRTGQIPNVRYAVTEASRGRYRGIATLAGASTTTEGISSLGMFLSVTCSEDAPGITRASITSAARALPAPLRADYSAQWVRTLHDCGIWHVPAADPAQKQPVTSDIPTMILEGQDDPITPPQYGADVAKTLSHGFSFVYPGVGHGAQYTDTCPYTMTLAFLRDPATKPPDACITAMTGP